MADAAGGILVADTFNDRLQKFRTNGAFVAEWGPGGSGNRQFADPRAASRDGDGNLYVADYGNNRVQKLSSTGAYLAQWGTQGITNGQFRCPAGIVVDRGYVYVADQANNRIQKFTRAGGFVATWGSLGSGPAQFALPTGLAVDKQGNLYVVDQGNSRIQKFSATGTPICRWGTSGSGAGQFRSPTSVAVDPEGNVYVADTGNSRIVVFAPTASTPVLSSPRVTVTAAATSAAPGRLQIVFTLSAPAGVEVRVLNLAGRVVRRLSEGAAPVGVNSLSWDGRSDRGAPVPAGRYLVSLTARGEDGAQAQTVLTATLTR